MAIFSLHFDLLYFCGEPQPKFVEEDLLVVGWSANAAFADLDAVPRREDDVHQADVAQFGQHAARFASQPGGLAHLCERLP